ncbi:DUF2911 domain-containing protein [Cesiribacter andamanensis]|uniref:DUF2911 domain-containing protein n=1 Tax=Cesiribacter andamanensis AMV16 TaxID=1279009 RepID=M7N872_9BACT|nr:DUF2911 domain-containing protein [Cesiribacter andamanensis]EMR03462.1 hypothetical protein ADICEAN_01395 [Cesiribacter andamanensis AMV16]
MIKNLFFYPLLCLLLLGFSESALAQEALKPRPSPLEMVTFKSPESTYVKITYGRPQKRGRTIFGELVPYGKVWRTGANEATEITTTGDISLAGNRIPAGTYTLFTIPEKDSWTIILNRDLGQWGAYRYDESKDVVRFKVPAKQLGTVYEAFTIEFEQTATDVLLKLMWDRTGVEIPVTFMN